MYPSSKESQQQPGLRWKVRWQQAEGGDSSPQLSTGEVTSGVLQFETIHYKKDLEQDWRKPKEEPKR